MRVVTVLIQGQQQEVPSPSAEPTVEKPEVPIPNAKKEDSAANPNSLAYSTAVFITKNVIATVVSGAQYYLGKYNEMTENYSNQNLVQNAQSIVGTISSITSSTINTASSLASAGPVGMAIGAVLGFTSSVVKEGLKIKRSYNEEVANVLKTAYSNYFYGERAGAVNNGRDTNE